MATVLSLGYNPGSGTGHTHANPDLAGWQDTYQHIGLGATSAAASGVPFGMNVKLFDNASGYPNFPSTWGASIASTLAANNGGVALQPIYVFNNVPTVAAIVSFLTSLPAKQKAAFNYQSEQENPASGLTGPQFLAGWASCSANLNAALAQMGGAPFWTRANFPFVTASYMAYYKTGGNTAFLPPRAQVDAYGADFYQHVGPGTTENVGAQSDPRFQNWLKNVQTVAGVNVPLAFTEYGIGMQTYTAATEAQRSALLAKDFAYITGSSAPSGTAPFMFYMYWYQMDATPNFYTFPLNPGETQAQAFTTISQWQSMITTVQGGPPPQTTITVTNPGNQASTTGQQASLQVIAVDSNPALALSYAQTGLPPGLALSSSTGLISGAPSQAGTFSVTVTVADGTGTTGTASFGWVVTSPVVETVTVVNPGNQAGTAHVAVALQITATDSLSLGLTFSAASLPTGLTIAPASGLISGTPTTPGTYNVTVTATSPTPVSGNAAFTWVISASAVTVANPGNQLSITNEVITPLQITATDNAGASVTFTATGLPTGLAISAGGLISGTCTVGGTFNTVVTGTDSFSSTGQAAFTWTVQSVTVVVTSPGPQSANLGDQISLQIAAVDSAGNVLTFADNGTLPPGLAINASTGLITGTPTAGGGFRVTITATDTVPVSGAATFLWTITDIVQLLEISVAPQPGQDIYGNPYQAGVTVGPAGGPQMRIGLDGLLHYGVNVFPMPAMVNGWGVGGGHANVLLDALGLLVVSMKILVIGTTTDGTNIWPTGSLPQNMRPIGTRIVACATDVSRSPESAGLRFSPDGSVQVFGVAATATRVDLYAALPLTF